MTERRHRLLIVDDQPSNIRVLAAALEPDHDVLFATSGEKALELARTRGVDLVLLDVRMPGLDGFEVCRRLKGDERTLRVPVIFVTAADEVEEEKHGFDVGGVDYITKPISPAIVRARVRTHLELKEARDLLEELASIDALTGLANRRELDGTLSSEWRRASRGQRWLTVSLLDVDYFKQFNDAYGHARGDDCLLRVAGALKRTFTRPGDLVSRYGGEEFAVILPDTEPAGARSLIWRLLREIRQLDIEHRHSPHEQRLSLSAGAVSLQPARAATPGNASAALEAADLELYKAKEQGRNRGFVLDPHAGEEVSITLSDEELG